MTKLKQIKSIEWSLILTLDFYTTPHISLEQHAVSYGDFHSCAGTGSAESVRTGEHAFSRRLHRSPKLTYFPNTSALKKHAERVERRQKITAKIHLNIQI
jgi:hypothetical protein